MSTPFFYYTLLVAIPGPVAPSPHKGSCNDLLTKETEHTWLHPISYMWQALPRNNDHTSLRKHAKEQFRSSWPTSVEAITEEKAPLRSDFTFAFYAFCVAGLFCFVSWK